MKKNNAWNVRRLVPATQRASVLFWRLSDFKLSFDRQNSIWKDWNRKIRVSALRMCTAAHCSYLDIYISQNIRLCKCNFEGKFLIWKFRFIILIFLLFVAEFVKSTAFCTLMLLFQRVDMFGLHFDAKITI